jgi:two-component sensor histidine kinase
MAGRRTRADFDREVKSRFGVLPNVFRTAQSAPGLIEELWGFAKSAYLDNPLPTLFKERLFVHLSRFCEARYCISRHVGFLVGHGNAAGDCTAPPSTVDEVVTLLRRPSLPQRAELDAALERLEAAIGPMPLPDAESLEEHDLFAAASLLFLTPSRAGRARAALVAALGATNFELLTAYLAFIRTAHYWTVTHPDLPLDEDIAGLLNAHQQLADLVMGDADVAGEAGELGHRLYGELLLLRREHDEGERLKQALAEREEAERRHMLLINELNHRVKNTLAIVQSLASQTLRGERVSATVRQSFIGRLIALAGAHDVLTSADWQTADLTEIVRRSVGPFDNGGGRIKVEGPAVRLSPRTALALAMAVHELATNAAQHGALSDDRGRVSVDWKVASGGAGDRLAWVWRELGGPAVARPRTTGFGARLIEHGLPTELGGAVGLYFEPGGVVCTIDAPLPLAGALN